MWETNHITKNEVETDNLEIFQLARTRQLVLIEFSKAFDANFRPSVGWKCTAAIALRTISTFSVNKIPS